MSTIKIGNDERQLADADSQWIAQEIQGRRTDGNSVCVVIVIKTTDLDMRLMTPGCGSSAGGGRQPTNREAAVLVLWRKHHLDEEKFSPGDVVAFVKQVRQYL